MKLVVQRSLNASVTVNNNIVGKIDYGYVVFVGFRIDDTLDDINILVDKLLHLRIFEDNNGKMNLSIQDVGGSILSISQFTLYANTKRGNRPSFLDSMPSNQASLMYDIWNQKLKEKNINVETGLFGTDMKVSLTNNGPVTIILESRV